MSTTPESGVYSTWYLAIRALFNGAVVLITAVFLALKTV